MASSSRRPSPATCSTSMGRCETCVALSKTKTHRSEGTSSVPEGVDLDTTGAHVRRRRDHLRPVRPREVPPDQAAGELGPTVPASAPDARPRLSSTARALSTTPPCVPACTRRATNAGSGSDARTAVSHHRARAHVPGRLRRLPAPQLRVRSPLAGRPQTNVTSSSTAAAPTSPGPGFEMKQVTDLIKQHTGGQLDVLVSTHRHRDHVSGFGGSATGRRVRRDGAARRRAGMDGASRHRQGRAGARLRRAGRHRARSFAAETETMEQLAERIVVLARALPADEQTQRATNAATTSRPTRSRTRRPSTT